MHSPAHTYTKKVQCCSCYILLVRQEEMTREAIPFLADTHVYLLPGGKHVNLWIMHDLIQLSVHIQWSVVPWIQIHGKHNIQAVLVKAFIMFNL